MKLLKVIFLLIGALTLLFLSLIVYGQISSDPRGIIEIKPSSDSQLVAYSYYDSGGGGAGYCSYGIDVIKLGGDIKLFTFHAGHKNVFEVISCENEFSFQWIEVDYKYELEISCPNDSLQKTKLNTFKDVNISYKNC